MKITSLEQAAEAIQPLFDAPAEPPKEQLKAGAEGVLYIAMSIANSLERLAMAAEDLVQIERNR